MNIEHRTSNAEHRIENRMTFAERMRVAARGLGEFRARDLADAMEVRTYRERALVRDYIRDFMKRGEFQRVDRGLYVYVKRDQRRGYLDIIWHLARSHRSFSTDEIERLSGAARATVLEYLRCLVAAGYLRQRVRGQWELVNDPGPVRPVNWGKCKRLKRQRKSLTEHTEGTEKKIDDRSGRGPNET